MSRDSYSAITGATQVAAVLGDPVEHSLSPTLLNAAFRSAGLDWILVALRVGVGDISRALVGLRALRLAGFSVTMPHKDAVVPLLDELSPTARRLGAVNCIAIEDGLLVGYNTDGGGFLDGLAHDSNLEVNGCSAVVVGAGGAARAVIQALAEAGAVEIAVVNRTFSKAERAALLAGEAGRIVSPEEVAEVTLAADLVVNATPVGMGEGADTGGSMPLRPDLLSRGQVVVDLIYHPIRTRWLSELAQRGIEVHSGLSMLVFQAARSFKLWTGQNAPVEAMKAEAIDALASPIRD